MNITNIIALLLLITLLLILYNNIQNKGMTYVKSDIDNNMYMVRDVKDKKKAANLLALVKKNIYAITNYMNNKLDNPKLASKKRYIEFKPYIKQLYEKIQNVVIKESSSNSIHTSYTVNKGEQIIFCIRSKSITRYVKSTDDIHNLNLVMYVALHEISHVACPEYNHTPLFKKIFRFICEEAIEMGIYNKIDFNMTPKEYCGMTITDSII